MNELVICSVFIPMIFLNPRKPSKTPLWLAVIVGLICVGYFIWQRSAEPLWWAPIVGFVALTVSECLETKKLQPFTALSALFFAQSLLSKNLEMTIIYISFGDMFLNAEIFSSHDLLQKNRAIRNVSRGLFSLLPAAFGVLLHLQGDFLILTVALTIIFRLFSWPLSHWIFQDKGDRSYPNLLISAVSTFALWHGQDFAPHPEWALVWMLIAVVLSLGARYIEVYIAMILGVSCISPLFGILGMTLWPLLVHKGKSVHILALFVALAGGLICEFSTKIILENSVYAIGAMSALILTRPFVASGIVSRPWFADFFDVLLSIILFGLFSYILPVTVPELGFPGVIFIGVFILAYIIGKTLYSKRPRFFNPLEGIKAPLIPDIKEPVSILNERTGRQIFLGDIGVVTKFYRALESEGHLIWLLGFLGVALIWGLR